MLTTMDGAGRIVIPKAIREQADLRPGAPLEVAFARGCIEMLPAEAPTRIVHEAGLPVLVVAGATEVSWRTPGGSKKPSGVGQGHGWMFVLEESGD
jgi:AbrB family looped-hinge helix DNA binding protein